MLVACDAGAPFRTDESEERGGRRRRVRPDAATKRQPAAADPDLVQVRFSSHPPSSPAAWTGTMFGCSIARGRVGLADEALAEGRIVGQVRRQELQRDLGLREGLVSEVHHPHAAASDLRLDAETGDLPPSSPRTRSFYTRTRPRRSHSSFIASAQLDRRLAVRRGLSVHRAFNLAGSRSSPRLPAFPHAWPRPRSGRSRRRSAQCPR